MILETEAASAFCQNDGCITLTTEERVLLADVGVGTIELVVLEVIEFCAGTGAIKFEVPPSYGALGGESYVDEHFFNLVEEKVPCFFDFCVQECPALSEELFHWWQCQKMAFDGSADFSANFVLIKSGLSKAWMEYDRIRHVHREESEYWSLFLNFHDFKRAFDTEVDKLIDLISQKIDMVQVVMVVGALAASPYLMKRTHEHFKGREQRFVIPEDPRLAVCVGGILLYFSTE
ncbi:hypothetical protein KP509_34G013400 [Ceratopteris richardii]|uniref:Uncharacterized protein n=1 Tax=Ceratopteris richardii TaxID=49495 RepID=A0A8T2QIF8_CERRI|nr:hypothetical protein KP509_34G013400 [Ceratopteris richardii]